MEETMTGAAVKKLLTYSGLKKLEEELERLKVVERKEIAQKIKEAREQMKSSADPVSMIEVMMRSW